MSQSKFCPSASAVLRDLKAISKKLGHVPDKTEYLEHGKYKEWQLRKLFRGYGGLLIKAGFDPKVVNPSLRISRLEMENKRLLMDLKDAQSEQVTSHTLQELIGSIGAHEFGAKPDWISPAKRGADNTGIPVLFLSDIHFDEVVRPEQVEFANSYDHDTAVKRIQHTFNTSVSLLKHHMAAPKYDGIVLALGGDLLSGNIHEELAETNAQSILRSLVDLTELLIGGINLLADEFGRVFVPCVVGNHGRLHKKPRAKNRVFDNFEWLIYQYLLKHFKNDKRVSFLIPEGSDAHFSVYGMNFLLTHGDQFKGGAGISGIFAPLMTGMARKQKRQQAIHRPFDIMMMGHWHQYIHTNSLIVNGSIKGLDEYAYIGNFGYEEPQQALFIVHPVNGVTFRMPVICNGYEKKKERAQSSLSW